jgi:protein-S-isoprenylcysteine O-methyltransferase Ste14
MKGKKPLPPTYLWAAIILINVIHFALPTRRFIVFPWNLFGILTIVAGAAVNLLADSAFKKFKTTVKPYQESSALITNGVFRISRNPMYLGFVLILSGNAILLGSLPSWLIIAGFIPIMHIVFIRVEEAMLEETFGDSWREYRKSVRRWI